MPVELPPKPKLAFLHKVFAPLWNYLKRRELIAGEGITLHEAGEDGTIISAPSQKRPKWNPLEPYLPRTTGRKVKINRGWLFEIYPTDAIIPLKEHDVWLDTVDDGRQKLQFLDADGVPPDFAVAGNVSWNYLHFKTTEQGAIKLLDDGTPNEYAEIVTQGSEADTTHHEPPDEDGNFTEGDYYILLFKTKLNALNELVIDVDSEPVLQQNFVWSSGRHTLYNLGGDADVYKEYELVTDTQRLRGPEGGYAVEVTEKANTWETKFLGASVGGKHDIYHDDEADDEAQFATIDNRDDDPQIHVTEQGVWNADPALSTRWLKIHGNDHDTPIEIDPAAGETGAAHVLATFEDGLKTGGTDLQWIELDVCESGSVTQKKFVIVP